jgi:hypothetical protein
MAPDQADPLNPYAPPAQNGDQEGNGLAIRSVDGAFAGPLFSTTQIGVATFLGTVLAGSALLQANYRVMGRAGAANRTVAVGLLMFAGLYILAFNVRDTVASIAINLLSVTMFSAVVSVLQRDSYGEHVIAGGARRSSWWVFAVIVMSFGVKSLVAFVIRRAVHLHLR